MTKPECSKNDPLDITDMKKKEETSSSKTAKDLFADFEPDDSDSSDSNEEHSVKNDSNEPPSKRSKNNKKYLPKYRKEWESKPELKAWLSESVHGNTYFYCKFCKKDYRCGYSDIHKHMSSKKHSLTAALPAFKAQKFKFRGLLCPVFTPFVNKRGACPDVNLKVIPKYANFLSACGVKGILINDVIGEGMSLTTKERIELTYTWAEICEKNNQFLMVQIGGAPLKDLIEMAKHASRTKVGAVVILPDLYSKPKSHLDLIKYIKIISEFTQDVPILYHHYPTYTNVKIDITSLLLDIIGEINTFVGVIFSTNDIQESVAALNFNREKFVVFMGTNQGILGAAACGFSCIMSTSMSFLPKLVESIFESVKNGDLKSAQTSQKLLTQTIDVISGEGDYVAALKAAADLITGLCGATTREPSQTLWPTNITKMQVKLRDLGVM